MPMGAMVGTLGGWTIATIGALGPMFAGKTLRKYRCIAGVSREVSFLFLGGGRKRFSESWGGG